MNISELAALTFVLAVHLAESSVLFAMISPLLGKRRRIPGSVIILCLYTARMSKFLYATNGGYHIAVITAALEFLIITAFFKGAWSQKLFALILFNAIMWLSDAVTFILLALANLMPFETVAYVPIIAQIVSRAILWGFAVVYRLNAEKMKWLAARPLLSIPPPLMFLVLQVLFQPIEDGRNLFYSAPLAFYAVYVAVLALAIVFCYALFRYRAVEKEQRLQIESAEKQIEVQGKYYSWLYEKCSEYDRKFHDLRGHLQFAGANDEYMRELSRRFADELIFTGNSRIDSIIFFEQGKAKEKGLELNVEGAVSRDMDWLGQVDCFIILHNAISNAFDAVLELPAQERESVTIRFADKGLRLSIEIINKTCRQQAELDWPPATTKGGTHQGFGLKNIRAVADKYDGHMEHEIKDGRFILSIMLQRPYREDT